MGVMMRQSRTSVAGKRFERGSSSTGTHLFTRRGRGSITIDALFLALVVMAAMVLMRDFARYLSAQKEADVSAGVAKVSDAIPIDTDKGDLKAARIASGLAWNSSEANGGDEDANFEHFLHTGASFSDSSLEKGSVTTQYKDGERHPVALPPPDAPVRLPRQDAEKKFGADEARKNRNGTLAMDGKSRGVGFRYGKNDVLDIGQVHNDNSSVSSQFSLEESHSAASLSRRHNWSRPLQPILDPQRTISFGELQSLFGLFPTNVSLVNRKTVPLLEEYDIRNDPLFRYMVVHDNLTYMDERYVPVARRGWGGVLGGAPASVPTDYLFHVRHSGDLEKGYGLYASTNIPEKTIIGTYGGELKKTSELVDGQYAWDAPAMYLEDPETGKWSNVSFVLDGMEVGNLLRFVNDLGEGSYNLEPVWVPVDNRWTLFYEASRPIPAGEELSIPYGEEYWGLRESTLTASSEQSEVRTNGGHSAPLYSENGRYSTPARSNESMPINTVNAPHESSKLSAGPDAPIEHAFRKILLKKTVLRKTYIPSVPEGAIVVPLGEGTPASQDGIVLKSPGIESKEYRTQSDFSTTSLTREAREENILTPERDAPFQRHGAEIGFQDTDLGTQIEVSGTTFPGGTEQVEARKDFSGGDNNNNDIMSSNIYSQGGDFRRSSSGWSQGAGTSVVHDNTRGDREFDEGLHGEGERNSVAFSGNGVAKVYSRVSGEQRNGENARTEARFAASGGLHEDSSLQYGSERENAATSNGNTEGASSGVVNLESEEELAEELDREARKAE